MRPRAFTSTAQGGHVAAISQDICFTPRHPGLLRTARSQLGRGSISPLNDTYLVPERTAERA
eukprot:3522642-Prymnesium_polylepis.1